MPRLALLHLSACAHRVRVESDAPGATVELRKRSKGAVIEKLRVHGAEEMAFYANF